MAEVAEKKASTGAGKDDEECHGKDDTDKPVEDDAESANGRVFSAPVATHEEDDDIDGGDVDSKGKLTEAQKRRRRRWARLGKQTLLNTSYFLLVRKSKLRI